ncbi:MAG: oxygenase MpaB family protein [Actinomycetota bacterium]
MTWTVNMEPAIAAGGGRALLLQVLHPLVAAGVDTYSDFAQDPFRRGLRTADMMLKLAFADADTSKRQAVTLRRMHQRVRGVSKEGIPYGALDPALLVWVWATLVDVSLLMYERAVRKLNVIDRERYYREQKLIAYACGVPRGGCPETHSDFTKYFADFIDNELRITDTARLVAFAGRHPPVPWPLGTPLGLLTTFVTAGLLPEPLRTELGYRWSPGRERLLRAVFLASRIGARTTPVGVRHVQNRYLIGRKTPLGWWRNRPVRVPPHLG